MRLLPVSSVLALLVACTFGPPSSDKGDTVDSGDTGDSGWQHEECVPEPVGGDTLAEGTYTLTIDEQIGENDCENEAGKGLHIHVGEDQTVWFTQDQSCVEAISDPGEDMAMPFYGTSDGETFVIEGYVVLPIGTCQIGVSATMTGQMTGDSAFTYRMDATADVHKELSPDACQLILGETENHTFSHLPCDQAWRGEGQL